MEGIRHLVDHDHVVCKVSGVVASAAPNWTVDQLAFNIQFTLDAFGHDRVMFSGDWPVCTLRSSYRRGVDLQNEITKEQTATSRQKLFCDNAVRVHRRPFDGMK